MSTKEADENNEDSKGPTTSKWIQSQIVARGITDRTLISAFEKVPRHEFVPRDLRDLAYADKPLPIGEHQTISQPYIVAYMTSLAKPRKGQRVLEIGTGSGYQAAILAELVDEVYSLEIVESLAHSAAETLKRLAYKNVYVRSGDGYQGWPEKAPFDIIMLTASPPLIPQTLFKQLKIKGVIIAPIGVERQHIVRWTKLSETGPLKKEDFIPVRFVPMTGEVQKFL